MTEPRPGADSDAGTHHPDSPAATAYCYRHPQRATLIRCTRCDRPICPECMRPASVGFHCPDDVTQARRTQRPLRNTFGALLRDSPPVVTGLMVAINVVLFALTATTGGGSWRDPGGSSLFQQLQEQPEAIFHGHRYYTLVTGGFLHFSVLHIASNMLVLIILGPALEQALGHWRFSALYGLSLVGGTAAVAAFGDPITVTAGASGAVFGMFAAGLVLGRRMNLDVQYLLGIVVLNFVLTFSISGISTLGHLGGFVTGGLVGLALGGLPNHRGRIPNRVQGAGLGAIAVLVLVLVLIGAVTV